MRSQEIKKYRNSMLNWYPLIKNLDIPMPKTIMIPFPTDFNYYSIFDGQENEDFNKYVFNVEEEAIQFGFPLFMRTDETSNKHGWKKTCYVTKRNQIGDHIYQLLEFTEMVGWMGGLYAHAIVLREFLDLEVVFEAFHGRMPIAKEFRFFFKDGKRLCWHPYWFPSCIVRPSDESWYGKLLDIEVISCDELDQLTEWGEQIGEAVSSIHDYWSIDFCKLRNGTWAMTDMAVGEDSFHWSTCKYAPEEMKRYGDPYAMPEVWKAKVRDSRSTSKEKSSKSDKERMREIMDKVHEMVATDPDILQRKEELIRELAITQEDLDKVISIIETTKGIYEKKGDKQ